MESFSNLIDGNILEGGGQIIRTALTCSSIFKKSIKIINIRGKRPKPGLQNQHLAGVNLLTDICSARVSGDCKQSEILEFHPKTINGGNYEIDTKTAGAVTLIIQSLVPTLLFAKEPSRLTLTGGTDADFAPPIDYYREIVLYHLMKMGIEVAIDINKRGFYPRGGGTVTVEIEPVSTFIKPITLIDRGQITAFRSICFVAGSLPVSIAKDMSDALKRVITSRPNYRNIPFNTAVFRERSDKSFGNGSGCLLIVETSTGCRFGFNLVGKREYSGSYMGENVGNQFINIFDNSAGCLDNQMQDQILVFMALAKGLSIIQCSELTLHSQTCIHILETIVGVKFLIEKVEGSQDVIVKCDGLGVNIDSLRF